MYEPLHDPHLKRFFANEHNREVVYFVENVFQEHNYLFQFAFTANQDTKSDYKQKRSSLLNQRFE
jgi:hypothetical protein